MITKLKKNSELSASEALYGFVGWLSTRKEKTVISSTDNCAPLAELIKQFCETNKLTDPIDNWQERLNHPKNEK